MEIHASMRQEGSKRWVARCEGEVALESVGSTRERCLASLRRCVERSLPSTERREPLTLVVEVLPVLAGVAEAAEVMGWDKRRVITYVDRGRFPAPIQALASGRVWLRSEVERFAADWRARRTAPGS
jgi:hypothetical protein